MLLDRLLQNLALRVEPFALCEVSRGWRLRMDELEWVTLHFVLNGEGRLKVGGGPPHLLRRYTLAVVPPQVGHAIEGGERAGHEVRARGASTGNSDLLRFVAGPRAHRDLVVACGRVQAVYVSGLGLFDLLREPIILDFSDSKKMQAAFEGLLEESRSALPGSQAMMSALMNECLVLIFRRLSHAPECRLPWLTALDDPRLAKVLDTVLERPERHYSLESLAEDP